VNPQNPLPAHPGLQTGGTAPPLPRNGQDCSPRRAPAGCQSRRTSRSGARSSRTPPRPLPALVVPPLLACAASAPPLAPTTSVDPTSRHRIWRVPTTAALRDAPLTLAPLPPPGYHGALTVHPRAVPLPGPATVGAHREGAEVLGASRLASSILSTRGDDHGGGRSGHGSLRWDPLRCSCPPITRTPPCLTPHENRQPPAAPPNRVTRLHVNDG